MKKILILLMMFIPLFAVAKERDNPFQQYKDNYFIVGNSDDQIKGQVSIKYYIFYPFEYSPCIAYTQTFIWDIYDDSAPFKNYDHNPEAFWQFGKDNYIKASIAHKSNGRDGEFSRSMNYYYGEGQIVFGSRLQLGFNIQARNYFHVSNRNEDIDEYFGYVQAESFLQLKNDGLFLDQEKIYIRCGGYKEYWLETGFQFRILTSYIQPKFYIQYYQGYVESMLDYNVKEKSIRAGLILQ